MLLIIRISLPDNVDWKIGKNWKIRNYNNKKLSRNIIEKYNDSFIVTHDFLWYLISTFFNYFYFF